MKITVTFQPLITSNTASVVLLAEGDELYSMASSDLAHMYRALPTLPTWIKHSFKSIRTLMSKAYTDVEINIVETSTSLQVLTFVQNNGTKLCISTYAARSKPEDITPSALVYIVSPRETVICRVYNNRRTTVWNPKTCRFEAYNLINPAYSALVSIGVNRYVSKLPKELTRAIITKTTTALGANVELFYEQLTDTRLQCGVHVHASNTFVPVAVDWEELTSKIDIKLPISKFRLTDY